MATAVVCHSCGSRIEVADDHARRKVRCPECGVMCEVVEAARAAPRPEKKRAEDPGQDSGQPEREAEELARQLWGDPDAPPPAKAPEPPRPAPDKMPAEESSFPVDRQRRRAAPPASPKRAAQTWTAEDEDASPYDVTGGVPRPCPACGRAMEAADLLCVGCGFDVRAGKKRGREYPPFQRSWEAGLSRDRRWSVFLMLAGSSLVLSAMTVVVFGVWFLSIGPWLGFLAMTSFLLGTFARIDMARDRRGNVKLTQTWYVCFVERPTQAIDLREYQGVVTGRSLDAGCFEWLIFFILLAYFIVPGVLWWYHVIRKTKFHTALTHSHNYPDVILYRGNSQEQAEEIAETLRDAAHLRYDRG